MSFVVSNALRVIRVVGVSMRRILIGLIAIVILIAIVAASIWTIRGRAPVPDAFSTQVNLAKAIPARPRLRPTMAIGRCRPRTMPSTRFSGLNEITPANVAELQVAFTFSTGTTEGFEAPPLVVNNTMYVVAPVAEQCFRARPDQARRAGEVDLQAQPRRCRERRRVLRSRQPRRLLLERASCS